MEQEQTPDAAVAAVAAPRRRRGRTTLLIAAALVLGVLSGTATGYAIQYDREPTPLPPLAQPSLDTPKALAPDDATTHKSINANRWHKTDDDLGKLLIEAPGGMKIVEPAGYDSLDSFATEFEEPDEVLRDFAKDGFRRIARSVWQNDRVTVAVQLLQFNDFSGADDYQSSQAGYMPEKKYAGNDGVAIPGVPDDLGHVWVYSELHEEPGYRPGREARAIARRGDVVLQLFYFDNRGKVDESAVVDLAKRQMERL
ncbi:hypothetical protein ACWDYJ_30845 [Streptomyces sp. NPDC003042]